MEPSETGQKWLKAAWITMILCAVLVAIGLITDYEVCIPVGALGMFVSLGMSAMSY